MPLIKNTSQLSNGNRMVLNYYSPKPCHYRRYRHKKARMAWQCKVLLPRSEITARFLRETKASLGYCRKNTTGWWYLPYVSRIMGVKEETIGILTYPVIHLQLPLAPGNQWGKSAIQLGEAVYYSPLIITLRCRPRMTAGSRQGSAKSHSRQYEPL